MPEKETNDTLKYVGYGILFILFIKCIWDIWDIRDKGGWKPKKKRRTDAPRKTISTGYCDQLRECIEDLAENLRPPQDYLEAGKAAAHDIFQLLKKNAHQHNITINRTRIAGSIGKGTAIWHKKVDGGKVKAPDFDCVIYINDQKPPFDNVLKSFVEILETHPRITKLRTTNKAVQFLYKDDEHGQIKFDLLPAPNYVNKLDSQRTRVGEAQDRGIRKDLNRKQRKHIREEGEIDVELNKLYSSGFNEKTVQVINDAVKKNEVTLKVVRLAKFWKANLNLGNEYFPARSSNIELIAIHAQQGTQVGRVCLISGFRRFLEQIADFGNLSVSLEHGIKNKNNPNSALADTSIPTIVDPANSFNNLAERISPEVVTMLESQAQQTLEKLEELRNREGYEDVKDPIKEIFGHKKNTYNYTGVIVLILVLAAAFVYSQM